MAKKELTFILPATTDAALERLQVLGRTIAETKTAVDQLQRLMDAKDAYRAAEAEAGFLNANIEALRKADWDRTVDSITIHKIVRASSEDESPLATHNVTFDRLGQVVTASLSGLERVVYAAIARDESKIPPRIRALAADAAVALDKWVSGKRRGYLSH